MQYPGSKIQDLLRTQFSPKLLFLYKFVINTILFSYRFTRFLEVVKKFVKNTILLIYKFTRFFEVSTFLQN